MSETTSAPSAPVETPTIAQMSAEASKAPKEASPAPEAADASEAPKADTSAEIQDLKEKIESGEKLTKKEEKKLEKFKLKVYGKEVDEEIDLSDKEGLTKRFQKAAAADQSLKEAAEIRKAALQFIDELKKNPKRVLQDSNIGLDPKKLAEEWLAEEIKEMEKSPEQKAKEQQLKEIEEYKAKVKEYEEKAALAEREKMEKHHEVELTTQISAALDVGGVPKNPKTIARIADYLMYGLKNGANLTAQDVVPLVKRDIDNELKDIMSSLSDDKLEEFLGKDIIGRLRKKNVAKAKALDSAGASNVRDTGKTSKDEKPKVEGKKLKYSEFFGL